MEKCPFYTRDKRPKTIESPTGDGYEKEYGVSLEENGHKILSVTGKTNAYNLIQSYAEECKIENILQRSIYDPGVLEQKIAMYDDFTEAPKTMYEAQNMIIEMENIWNSLSAEERDKYDNEISQFIAQTGSDKWMRTMGYVNEDEVKEVLETPNPKPSEGGENE